MLQALRKFARLLSRDENQLSLELVSAEKPKNADDLASELHRLGLARGYNIRLTRNRTVVVSHSRGDLRIHQGFLEAPEEVWRAIVVFVQGRTRAARADARRTIIEFPLQGLQERRSRGPHKTHADDAAIASRLTEWHVRYNSEHFDGKLQSVPIGISRRMRSRLGHYSPATEDGRPAEIVISRRHFRRHGWDETLQTLLHEMVHQWQDESGQVIDHGREFRRKARAVGVAPHATRRVA